MGRFRDFSNEGEADGGIDMSPMIDCVFILLIFFIVTTTFVEETGIEVDKPQAAASVSLKKNSVMFALTKEGEVYFDSKPVGIGAVRGIVARKMLKEKQRKQDSNGRPANPFHRPPVSQLKRTQESFLQDASCWS